MSHNSESKSLEQQITELETIVQSMEQELPLAEALLKFEQGIKLVRECQALLTEAEQRVLLVTEESEGIMEKQFNLESKE